MKNLPKIVDNSSLEETPINLQEQEEMLNNLLKKEKINIGLIPSNRGLKKPKDCLTIVRLICPIKNSSSYIRKRPSGGKPTHYFGVWVEVLYTDKKSWGTGYYVTSNGFKKEKIDYHNKIIHLDLCAQDYQILLKFLKKYDYFNKNFTSDGFVAIFISKQKNKQILIKNLTKTVTEFCIERIHYKAKRKIKKLIKNHDQLYDLNYVINEVKSY